MTKPIFSGKLYVQSLKKVRTLGIAMMIAIVLLNMFLPIMGIIDGIETDRRYQEDIVYYEEHKDEFLYVDYDFYTPQVSEIEDWEFAPFLWAVIGFAPFLVIAMFSFLNERKQSDFYHSLPQTRVCVYLSMIAAIFTWLAGVILVSVSVNAILFSFAKYLTFSLSTILANIVFYFVLGLFVSSSLAVAMMITGTITSNLLIYAFLLLFPRYLVLLFQSALDSGIHILPNVMDRFTLLSFTRFLPLSWIEGDIFNDGYLSDGAMLIYSAVIGVLMFVLAGVLYHFRRSESAEKSAPNNLAQHIYRTAFVTAMAITIPFAIALDGLNEIVILLLLFTLVVHVIYELMTTRKIKKMVKSLPLIVIPLALAAVFGVTLLGVSAYVYSVRPDAEDVTSVSFSDTYANSYGEYKLQNMEITERSAVELAVKGLHNTLDDKTFTDNDPGDWYVVNYKLASGRTIGRYIWLSDTDLDKIYMADGVKDVYLSLPADEEIASFYIEPFPVSRYVSYLSIDIEEKYAQYYEDINNKPENIKELAVYEATQEAVWNLFKEEYNALSEEEKLYLMSFSDYRKRPASYYIEVYMHESESDNWRYPNLFFYPLLPDLTPRTIDFIMSLYGSEEDILANLRKMKSADDYYGSFMLYDAGVDLKYSWDAIDAEVFFEKITLDSHLFDESEKYVLVDIDGYAYWLSLTYEEYKAIIEVIADRMEGTTGAIYIED